MNEETETLLEFPSSFPIKALGRDVPEFHQAVMELVAVHASFEPQTDVRAQPSKNGNFVSVTITFTAESQAQLDTIYQSLHDHELVLMVF
jgi:putative lipoic acid-binding regulatory protein